MKWIRSESFNGVLLILILGYCGWKLLAPARQIYQSERHDESVALGNKDLSFQSERGIGIDGRVVNPEPATSGTPVLVFILHGNNLQRDLKFWKDTAAAVPKGYALKLVGYCDGDACRNALKRDPSLANFPVITYGEVTSAQALINADEDGNGFLRKNAKSAPKPIAWRKANATPSNVIQEVMQ